MVASQARKLLAAPTGDTFKAKRDRAILSTLLYHALRRDELCKLKIKDGVPSRKGFLRTIAAVHHQRIQVVVASLDRHIVRRNPPPPML
jgi:site-specific recombinase XerD